MGMLVIIKSFRIKKNRIELSTGTILEENLVQSALHQTLGDEFTFQKYNKLKLKAKSTLEWLTKTVNVPEWPVLTFALKSASKSVARLGNCCLAMIPNILTEFEDL